MKRFATMLVGLVLMLAPSSALAGTTSECQTYASETCNVATSNSNDANSNVATSAGSTLPFTGIDVGLLVLVGGGLLGTGVAVRRISRRTN
jgi:hypothetical protein